MQPVRAGARPVFAAIASSAAAASRMNLSRRLGSIGRASACKIHFFGKFHRLGSFSAGCGRFGLALILRFLHGFLGCRPLLRLGSPPSARRWPGSRLSRPKSASRSRAAGRTTPLFAVFLHPHCRSRRRPQGPPAASVEAFPERAVLTRTKEVRPRSRKATAKRRLPR